MNTKDLEVAEKAIEDLANAADLEIESLKKELYSLKKTLEEYGINEKEMSPISQIEYICLNQIDKLQKRSNERVLFDDEIKALDLLHKNLRMARGEISKKEPKGKQDSADNLLKIVRGEN